MPHAEAAAKPQTAGDEFFRERIAPLFEKRCVGCHQGPEPKGELSFTTRDAALKGSTNGPVIVPGKPDRSRILEMISGERPRMPRNAAPLSQADRELIRRWIAEGANWPADVTLRDRKFEGSDWWSLKPLQVAAPPIADDPWIRTPIDAFLVAKLRALKLTPAPEADRRTQIRRLTFNLHGLPPTPDEIDAFEDDRLPNAYERLVDRLLASPRYGERWGRHWLDVVHFGESHGYDKDKPRLNAWPYRDYVIAAFNHDKPYSRFVQEQLAGDILFPGEPEGIIATGFIAAGPWDFVGHVELREGTVDKQIARSNDRDDMLATTMSTFVSLTAHCARCHDHKFDPIPQTDYYRLQAVFAGVDRADRPYDQQPEILARRQLLEARRELLDAEQRRLNALIERLQSPELKGLDQRLAGLRKQLEALPPATAAPPSPSLGYHSQIMQAPEVVKWVQVDLGKSSPLDEIVLVPAHVKYGGHPGPGFGFPPRFRVEIADDGDFAKPVMIADHTAADFTHPGDAPVRFAAGGKQGRFVRVTATRLWPRTADWIFALSELLVFSGKQNVAAGTTVTALDSIEAGTAWGKAYLVDGFNSQIALASPEASPTNGYHSQIEPQPDVEKWVQVDLGQPQALDTVRLIPARPTDFPDTPGFGFPMRFRVDVSATADFAERTALLDQTSQDFANPGDQPVVIAANGLRARYIRITAKRLWKRSGDYVFALGELQAEADGANVAAGMQVTALDSIEGGRWSAAALVDGYTSRQRLGATGTGAIDFLRRYELQAEIDRVATERRARAEQLLEPEQRTRLAAVGSELAEVTSGLSSLPASAALVYAVAPGTPRPIYLLQRGNVKTPGPLVEPGALRCLPGLDADFKLEQPEQEGTRRAALARWITDPQNVLMRRSIVNRVWHYHFGRGLVDTPNDFGRMGSEPTHPELLEWLAADFQANGESFKSLHRLILTSAVYRQSSQSNPAAEKVDAGNRYLWRMNRARLEAEEVRDAVLAVSGRLDLRMGGPSVQQFFFKDDHSPIYDYEQFDVDDPRSNRRSIYRFLVRSVPDPFMDRLDCADPSILTPKRNTTLTAIQALAMLNNRFIVRQAEHFAERVSRDSDDPARQISAAYRLALGRLPSQEETELLRAHAARHGLENVCRLILNSNEFLFVD